MKKLFYERECKNVRKNYRFDEIEYSWIFYIDLITSIAQFAAAYVYIGNWLVFALVNFTRTLIGLIPLRGALKSFNKRN